MPDLPVDDARVGVPPLVTVLRMRLRQSRPEDLVRCAAVFGELAADVARAQSSARESSHVVWHGRAGDAYQHELAALAADLQCVQVAYDEACDVLLRDARGLDLAREQARTAEAVTATAEAERAAAVVSGGLLWSDGDAGLARGAALLEAAHEVHAQAAAPAIRALEDLAGRVPRTSMGVSRFLSQMLKGLGGVVKGTGELAVTAIRSLPLVGSDSGRHAARHELADEAEAMVQPWLLVEQLLQQWREGQGGRALGAALGMAATHRLGVRAKDAELFGTYVALPDQVVRAVRGVRPDLVDDTWVLARQQRCSTRTCSGCARCRCPSGGRSWLTRSICCTTRPTAGTPSSSTSADRSPSCSAARSPSFPGSRASAPSRPWRRRPAPLTAPSRPPTCRPTSTCGCRPRVPRRRSGLPFLGWLVLCLILWASRSLPATSSSSW